MLIGQDFYKVSHLFFSVTKRQDRCINTKTYWWVVNCIIVCLQISRPWTWSDISDLSAKCLHPWVLHPWVLHRHLLSTGCFTEVLFCLCFWKTYCSASESKIILQVNNFLGVFHVVMKVVLCKNAYKYSKEKNGHLWFSFKIFCLCVHSQIPFCLCFFGIFLLLRLRSTAGTFCLYQLLQHAGKVRLPAHLMNSVEEKNLILEVNVYIYWYTNL